jgi:hypothetical protein
MKPDQLKMKKHIPSLIALTAVIITIASVLYIHRPAAIEESTWDDVLTEAEDGGYQLISTEALADHYLQGSPAPLLIDTRQEWEYRTGHIGGRSIFPWNPHGGPGGARPASWQMFWGRTKIARWSFAERA